MELVENITQYLLIRLQDPYYEFNSVLVHLDKPTIRRFKWYKIHMYKMVRQRLPLRRIIFEGQNVSPLFIPKKREPKLDDWVWTSNESKHYLQAKRREIAVLKRYYSTTPYQTSLSVSNIGDQPYFRISILVVNNNSITEYNSIDVPFSEIGI